jgi:hypothetical protein
VKPIGSNREARLETELGKEKSFNERFSPLGSFGFEEVVLETNEHTVKIAVRSVAVLP